MIALNIERPGLAFIGVDRTTGARVPFSGAGAIAEANGHFIRFAPELGRATAARFVETGFVPRGGDAFALHGADRAATRIATLLRG